MTKRSDWQKRLFIGSFLLPGLALYTLFVAYPTAEGLRISLMDESLNISLRLVFEGRPAGGSWTDLVGTALVNYKRLLFEITEPVDLYRVRRYLTNSLLLFLFTLLDLLLGFAIAVVSASPPAVTAQITSATDVTEEEYLAVKNGPDGGVDIRLHKDGVRHLVQCKNWRSRRVGVRVVREVYGVLTAENAQQAFVVCSGDFTPDARRFAAGKPIRLVDGDALHAMVQGVRRPDGNDRGSAAMVAPDTSADSASLCPKCGGQLVVRTARRGEFAGRRFLGCETYPNCRYTRNLPDA